MINRLKIDEGFPERVLYTSLILTGIIFLISISIWSFEVTAGLTMGMGISIGFFWLLRLIITRLSKGFSKKMENLAHAVSLHFMYYNFSRIHQTLRVTSAMEAGVSDHAWEVEEILNLLNSN